LRNQALVTRLIRRNLKGEDQMQPVRFIMLGGFLGAGKTTALSRLARHYQSQGLRVGIVTNDQAEGLVDTNSLRSQNLPVAEVPGACFCCKFDDLISVIGKLQDDEQPNVILAEPVGSCTDLVATVIQPLRGLYGDRFHVGPYAVLFKPSHGRKILRDENEGGFSPKAAYIFRKQLEEADAIVLNRIDQLHDDEKAEIEELIRSHFPNTPLVQLSARTGQGFDALTELLDQEGAFGRRILQIDYDTYAEGEAELGWLNSNMRLTGRHNWPLDQVLLELLNGVRTGIKNSGEIAHLKVIGMADGVYAVVNAVSNDSGTELSLASNVEVSEADVIVNARAAIDPDRLQETVIEVAEHVCHKYNIGIEFRQTQSLRPGRPVPTHRYQVPVG